MINGTISAIQADHLNTPRRLSNTSAQAVWQWKYSAFGDEQPTLAANRFADLAMNPNPGTTAIPPVTFNLRYPGQYADVEIGLNYNYFRSYNSDTGGYTQADPIGLDGGWNRFGYVEGNPLSYFDSQGLIKGISNPRELLPLEGGGGGGFSGGGSGFGLTSNAARRDVMREAGIPTSQQPISQSRNASGREYSYDVSASGGGTQRMSVQQQTRDRSHPGQSHWEAGRVKINIDTGQIRYNQYGCPALMNGKSKVDY